MSRAAPRGFAALRMQGWCFRQGFLETSAEALEAQAGTTSSRVAMVGMLLFAHGEWEG